MNEDLLPEANGPELQSQEYHPSEKSKSVQIRTVSEYS